MAIKLHANTELAILGSKKIREAEQALAKEQEVQAKIKRDAELLLSAERIKAAALAVELAEARKKELPPDELMQVAVRRKELASDQLKKLEQLRNNPATRDAITDGELKQQQLLIEQLTAEIEHNQNKGIAADRCPETCRRRGQIGPGYRSPGREEHQRC